MMSSQWSSLSLLLTLGLAHVGWNQLSRYVDEARFGRLASICVVDRAAAAALHPREDVEHPDRADVATDVGVVTQ